MAASVKSDWEVDIMRQAGHIVGEGLKLLQKTVRPGISTGELDAVFEKHVRTSGAVPTFKGYVGDAAVTVGVGKISAKAQRLIDTTRESLEAAIAVVGPGAKLSVIAATIQNYAESRGYAVVKKYVGHGIGQKLHEEPQVPNFVGDNLASWEFILRPGHCIAIEPMVNEGTDDVRTLSDDWTVVTKDRRLSAHFEHTIAVTKDGREVLTRV